MWFSDGELQFFVVGTPNGPGLVEPAAVNPHDPNAALNYGFAQITGGGLRRWQYIYLLAGCLTFIFGLFCFAMPSSPVSAWFLAPDERVVAAERLRRGQMGVRCQKIKLAQVKECLVDIKFYLIAIMMASA